MGEKKNKNNLDDILGELNSIQDVNDNSENQKINTESLAFIQDILENTKSNIQKALDLIQTQQVSGSELLNSLKKFRQASKGGGELETDRVLEGVFDGEQMVGSDGKQYNVPANYASKSKLVEGDILKLTISKDGSFIYKQIGPIEREKLITTLVQDEVTGDWFAVGDNNKKWRLLTASVTYFHGNPGDEIVILAPKGSKSQWAAVENIIKK